MGIAGARSQRLGVDEAIGSVEVIGVMGGLGFGMNQDEIGMNDLDLMTWD
jgi:hypothetical protein